MTIGRHTGLSPTALQTEPGLHPPAEVHVREGWTQMRTGSGHSPSGASVSHFPPSPQSASAAHGSHEQWGHVISGGGAGPPQ